MDEPAGEPVSLDDVIRPLQRRWPIIVAAILVGVVVGLLRYLRSEPEYQSTSEILIHEKSISLPVESMDAYGGSNPLLKRGRTSGIDHAFVLTSPLLANETATQLNGTSWGNVETRIGAIRKGLSVTSIRGNGSMLRLSFRASDPADSKLALDTIIDAYEGFLTRTNTKVGEEVSDLVTQASQHLRKDLEQEQKSYDDFKDGLKEKKVFWRNGEAINIHQERQLLIETRRSETVIQKTAVETQLSAIESARERNVPKHVLLRVLGESGDRLERNTRVGGGSQADSIRKQLQIELDLTSQDYATGHPKVVSLKRRLDAIGRYDELQPASLATDDRPRDLVAEYTEWLEERLRNLESELDALDKSYEEEQSAADEIADAIDKDAQHREAIARTKAILDSVTSRLGDIDLIQEVGNDRYRIETLSLAKLGSKVAPKLNSFLVFGAGFGNGSRTWACIPRRSHGSSIQGARRCQSHSWFATRWFRSVRITMPSKDVEDESPLDPQLVAAHRPRSSAAEQFRAMRTALYFGASGKDCRVVQVTSSVPQDGKSTIISNLAITIAQSGRRVLLLDADFRRPVIHTRFGLSNEKGTCIGRCGIGRARRGSPGNKHRQSVRSDVREAAQKSL